MGPRSSKAAKGSKAARSVAWQARHDAEAARDTYQAVKYSTKAAASQVKAAIANPRRLSSTSPPAYASSTFIIVGAGPTGLWCSVQLKLRLPGASVVVYEKRNAYVRRQQLRLGSDAFHHAIMESQAQHPELAEVRAIQASRRGIRISELETLLRRFAERLGVVVHPNVEITGASDLWARHAPATVAAVIGADGRRSTVRRTLLGDDLRVDPPEKGGKDAASDEHVRQFSLQYTVYTNVDVRGRVEKLKQGLKQMYKDSVKLRHHNVRCVIGRYKEDVDATSVTAIFFISEETNAMMASCTRRDPGRVAGTPPDGRVPAKLRDDVRVFFSSHFGDRVDLGSVGLSIVPIHRYRSKHWARMVEVAPDAGAPAAAVTKPGPPAAVATASAESIDQAPVVAAAPPPTPPPAASTSVPVFLVGDACFGVPYFRALTNGLKVASTAAAALAAQRCGDDPALAVATFTAYVSGLWLRASAKADVTALAAGGLNKALRGSAATKRVARKSKAAK